MEDGNFVKVTGLTSVEGRALNGKIGIIRSVDSDGGRNRAELIGRIEEEKQNEIEAFQDRYLAINHLNLEGILPQGRVHPLFYKYLHGKFLHVEDTEERIEILQEKFAIPGFLRRGTRTPRWPPSYASSKGSRDRCRT